MLSGGITAVGILDGESAPYYFTELFAWSNEETTVNNTTSPFGNDTEPNPAWKNYIPENTQGLAYLWCKQTKYVWNAQTRQYVIASSGTPQYYRKSGTNGTSIDVKGSIDYYMYPPTASAALVGKTAVGIPSTSAAYMKYIFECRSVSQGQYGWVPSSVAASDGDSYTILNEGANDQAPSSQGHLVLWSDEANQWIDLGPFQGQPGKTYYTHVAWADDVTISGSTLPIPQGQTTRPNASSVTGGSIVQTGNKPWMGIMVDETAQDSTTYTNYTWSKVHGNTFVLDLTNDMDAIQYAGGTKVGDNATTQAMLLKDGVPVDVYDENDNPDGVQFSVATHSGIPNDGYGLSVSGSAATATVNKLSELKGLLVIQAVYQGNVYYKTFTVDKLIDKPKYELKLSKDIIAVNMSDSPSAQTDNVKVYKTVINSSGTTTTSLVTDLSAEGLMLWAQDGANQPSDKTSDYGNDGYTHTVSLALDSVTFYLTNNSATYETVLTNLIDRENVPVTKVENGAAGANAIRIDIDNQADIVAVDSNGKVRFTRTVIAKARIYNGGNVQTTGVSLPSQASAYMAALAIGGVTPVLYHTSIDNANKITGTTTSVTGGVLFVVWTFTKGTQMAVNTAWPATIQLAYSSHTYDAAFSLTSSDTAAIYQLLPSVTELAFGVDASTNDFTPSSLGVYCGYKKIDAESETPYAGNNRANLCKSNVSYTEDGQTKYGTAPYNIFYRMLKSDGTYYTYNNISWFWAKDLTLGTLDVSANGNIIEVEFVLSSANGVSGETINDSNIYDHETIPILRSGKKGAKGDDAIVCDLDNDHEDFLYNDAGTKVSGNVTSQAHLYKGATEQTTDVAWAVSCDNGANWVEAGNNYTSGNAKAKISTSGLLTVEELYVDQVAIKVRATYNSNPYYADFTSKKLRQDKYNLVIEPNSIPYNTSETWSNKTVVITADRMSIDGTVVKGIDINTNNGDIKLAAKYRTTATGTPTWHTISGGTSAERTMNITGNIVQHNNSILIELRKTKPNATYVVSDPNTYTVKDYETIPINRSANGENGSDAWQFDLDVPVLSWNTNSNDRLAQFDTKDVYVRAYKGNVSQGASVSSITLPLGFVGVLSSGGHISITPYLQYTSYTNSNVTVYVIGTTPSVGDKAYDSSMIEIGTITDVGSGHIDVGGVRYTNRVTHYTELAEPFTSVVSATADSVSRTVALTITPNKEGAAGQKGDATRQPYEWGTWEAFIADNSNTFTANKYEAPYFIRTEEFTDQNGIKRTGERKWLWVGEDGTFNPTQVDAPSSSSSDWTLMVTDFKYLISEAQIADYGKMGAGIFSKDYAFSQYGRVDGAGRDIDHYKNFRPEFFNGNAYEMFSGTKAIDHATYYDNNHMYSFGEIFLEEDINYTFDFTFGQATSNLSVRLFDLTDNTKLTSWSLSQSGQLQTNNGSTNVLSGKGGRSYLLCVFAPGNNGSVTITNITVTASKAFRPNIYIDWRMGEIFSMLGHFINVFVEGVINNLIQEINNDNMSQFGKYTTGAQRFWMNPTKIGSIIRYKVTHSLALPSAYCTAGEPYETELCDTDDGIHQMSVDELRQCIGKKIYVLTDGNSSMTKVVCGKDSSNGMLEYAGFDGLFEWPTEGTTQANMFYVLECKMGEKNSHECIYWELQATYSKLPSNLTSA